MSLAELRALFESHFGYEPTVVGIAPGRVNLIGEHTDYNEGFVFPGAIDRGLLIAAKPTNGPSRVVSRQLGQGESFDVVTIVPGSGMKSWAKYPAGMAWALQQGGARLPNIEAYIDSDIPIGSGVSSSAAIEMAFGVIWNQLGQLGLKNAELAKLGQVCENQFVGVNSGIMDQMASAMGRENMAMFLDTRTLEIEYAPLPEGVSVVLCDTKKPRALTDSAYNERRSQCEEASRVLGVRALRDATMEMLDQAKAQLPEVVYRRARHVITENQRCVDFKDALNSGDLELAGKLMRMSHVSLRDDYEVSCRELDVMADAASAAPGCVGARMTGAGFGGACVALVRNEQLDEFKRATLKAYDASTGLGGEAMACRLVEGARVLDHP